MSLSTCWIASLFVVLLSGGNSLAAQTAAVAKYRSVRSIAISGSSFVVRGENLSRVDICAVPSGTAISPDACELLGTASRVGPPGRHEKWVLPISSVPIGISATEIYAKGFDAQGKFVGRKSLPYVGVCAIEDILEKHAQP